MRGRGKAFSDDEIREIRAKWADRGFAPVTQVELAEEYDTTQGMISGIVNYRHYKHVK